MLKHIRFRSTNAYEMAIVHPEYREEDINRITNYMQWVEPDALCYKREQIMAFLSIGEAASLVRVEFVPEHFVGSLTMDDTRRYRAFLLNNGLSGRVTGVCDGAIYGKRPGQGLPMQFNLCLALDMDDLQLEDPSDWEQRVYP